VYRCDERLKTKKEESTLLSDTGLVVELEHLKTKTRLIDEKFVSVRGECETSLVVVVVYYKSRNREVKSKNWRPSGFGRVDALPSRQGILFIYVV
jgi:hypothetical protein